MKTSKDCVLPKVVKDKHGLCFRCEYRAKYFETNSGPRYECQQGCLSVFSCYMYKPVVPLAVSPKEGDERPMTLGLTGCRVSRSALQPDFVLAASLVSKDSVVPYWIPKPAKKDKGKANGRAKSKQNKN